MNNLPEEYVDRMKEFFKEEWEAFYASYEAKARRSLRLNPLKKVNGKEVSAAELPFSLTEIPWCKEGFYYEEEDAPGKHPFHEAGAYYIQEASAMKPVTLLDVKPGMHVLDLCAAPGGKSTQIGALLKGEGILISNEPIPTRAKILSENMERMGIVNALTVSEMPDALAERFEGFFERILVDAPCSGEGMFRKHPEAIDEWSVANVETCIERQRQILKAAYRMLCPGGRLVYSTCTFEYGENEGNAEWFVNEYEDMKLLSSERMLPHKVEGEGHFVAVFEKNGEAVTSVPRGGYEKGTLQKLKLDSTSLGEFVEDTIKSSSDIYKKIKEGNFCAYKDMLYLLPDDCPSLSGLKVLRPGLALGSFKKNRFEPEHALALALAPSDVVRYFDVDINEATSYIEGLTVNCDPDLKGWGLVCVCGMSLGWGKAGAGTVKNHYPKGLRKKLG